ncbi:MAG: class I SAM-dependent methyltransferase, partial [Lachnospiraceae bacterium]|nr:class I SAM-dependent methyltransferase [Lachnospiraceae bacterium]
MKQEKIGNVTLDYTWYPGKDLYTDGDEEKKLLELVTNSGEKDYDSVIARERSWAVLYHLSHVRENILGNLRIGRDESVLEIGSGCGAVTGALLGKCASLTCVDLSRRRSMISAQRHKDKDSFTILVGNFRDIEPNLPRYDLITLIGVFEYAKAYIGTDEPYEEFLRRIRAHLKPGGRIVIAIENRLGLKYFAGSAEDHTGVYFDGIENYPDERTPARTFSRPALERIFDKCGLGHRVFEYPYPDYKLPSAVYSDRFLPAQGELRKNRWNFDRKRMEILDEDRAADSVISDGLYPQFANSFLVTL